MIHVEMIPEDIEYGDTGGRSCPIARALRRVLVDSYFYVGPDYIAIGSTFTNDRIEFPSPMEMRQWITYHDQGIHYPRPLVSFDIDLESGNILNYSEREAIV